MDNNKGLKLGIIFSYITLFVEFLVVLVYTPFMLQKLGQQQYGLYNLGQSAVSYLSLAEFGLGNAVVRYASKFRAEGNENKTSSLYGMFMYIYNFLAIVILAGGLLICLFSDRMFSVTTGAEGHRQLKIIILIMVLNLAFTFSTQTYNAIITSYERFTFLKVTNLGYILLKPLVMIPLLIWGYKAIALSLVTFILSAGLHIVNIIYVKKVLKIKVDIRRKNMDFSILKEILGYSFFIFLGAIVGQLNDNADNIILGVICGEMAVAVYSIGYQINLYIQQLPGMISGVLFPRVTTRIAQGATMDEMSGFVTKIGRIQFYIVFLLCSGFTIFGQEFISLWAGEGYEMAYWIILALVLPAMIPNIQTTAVLVLQALNKHQFKAISYLICAVINVALSIPAGIKWGPIGCAVCTGISTLLTKGVLINWYYWKKIKLKIGAFWGNILLQLLKMLPIILVGIGLNYLFDSTGWFSLIGKIIIYSGVFIGYIVFVCFNKEEKGLLTGFLQRICRKDQKEKETNIEK